MPRNPKGKANPKAKQKAKPAKALPNKPRKRVKPKKVVENEETEQLLENYSDE